MVAYSYNRMFCPQIEDGSKKQTIRAHRKRHTRPGEPIQQYHAMRTKQCRKLITDPTCKKVRQIRFVVPPPRVFRTNHIPAFHINLGRDEFEIRANYWLDHFARADGFKPERLAEFLLKHDEEWVEWMRPIHLMTAFWLDTHGPGEFEGVLIEWE